jgi:SMI1 / KNR4 family (SUKH-1)
MGIHLEQRSQILDEDITMSISRWKDLFDSLEMCPSPHGENIWSAEMLSKFESDSGVLLPTEYKEYCQVFGAGIFGSYMRIRYPNDEILGISLSNMKEDLAYEKEVGLWEGRDSEAIERKLNFAYPFADNSWGNIAFWDLETYSATDESYDIYLGCGLKFYFICRDFYEFITEFCLGTKSFSILPDDFQPGKEDIIQTFSPYKWRNFYTKGRSS